jgi:hypothetical protein
MEISRLQLGDPHDPDHVSVIERLLVCTFVAGPNEILLSRKGLSFLLDPKLPFGDMADLGFTPSVCPIPGLVFGREYARSPGRGRACRSARRRQDSLRNGRSHRIVHVSTP